MRKDFIIDAIQVRESLLYGADAILLIARILSKERLNELLALSRELGLTPLTEVHDLQDLEKAVDCGAEIIGINNRNLDTFEVDLQTTLDLAPQVPEKCIIVSESGISHPGGYTTFKKDRYSGCPRGDLHHEEYGYRDEDKGVVRGWQFGIREKEW